MQEDGSTTNITGGSLIGVGNLCFYSYKDILEAFVKGWKIKNITHKENRTVSSSEQTKHAKWEVIAEKL